MRWGFLFHEAGVKLPGRAWARRGAGLEVSKGDSAVPAWMGQWCGINASGHATTFATHLFLFCFVFFLILFFFLQIPPKYKGLGRRRHPWESRRPGAQQAAGVRPCAFLTPTAAYKISPSAEGFK